MPQPPAARSSRSMSGSSATQELAAPERRGSASSAGSAARDMLLSPNTATRLVDEDRKKETAKRNADSARCSECLSPHYSLLSSVDVDSPESLARARKATEQRQRRSRADSTDTESEASMSHTPLARTHSELSEGEYSPDERPSSYVEYSDSDTSINETNDMTTLNI